MRLFFALVAAVFLLAGACKPAGKPGSLAQALRSVPRSPLCNQNLPSDWASTWPVPTGGGEGREFEVLFYALDRSAQDASGLPRVRVMQPRGRALFSLDGAVSVCEASGDEAKPLDGERYPDAVMGLEEDEFDKAEARLLTLTERTARQFAGKAPVDKAALADFAKRFDAMAEPALASAYYKAQPRFWDWLSQQTGQRLPAGR
jgi:hypothetical protein